MLLAALGDVHGQWREAMALLGAACTSVEITPGGMAAIFQVGDAEPQRNGDEAAMVSGPAQYRKLGDFAEVVSGKIVVPAPLYFIAGNHEPFGALDADGGLVGGSGQWGPNVTYLGRDGLFEIAELRVGFLSGIYGEADRVSVRDYQLSGVSRRGLLLTVDGSCQNLDIMVRY